MRRADVVIGAGFGDEGKGLVTDFLAAPYGTDGLVVRFNGGAQAGHTVQTPAGLRHVFHHVGSGALAGAATYLSRYFICNPLLLDKELPLLASIGCHPSIYADPGCLVTTPYDMMLNQIAEDMRGDQRHGSCGQGIGETIVRNMRPDFSFSLADIADASALRSKLKLIQTNWVPQRLAELAINDIPEIWQQRLSSDGIIEYFCQTVTSFRSVVEIASLADIAARRPVIFEGAQGLMLDQDKGWFPHVTRSNTGLKNAAILATEIGIDDLQVHYLTRAYATRHGAGPLAHEVDNKPYAGIVDETNIPNAYQGTLRFGWLDVNLLSWFINEDLAAYRQDMTVKPQLCVTCLDQVGPLVTYARNGTLHQAEPNRLVQLLCAAVAAQGGLVSYGPTRADVMRFAADTTIHCYA